MDRPIARTAGIIIEELDDELLLYDETSDMACRLNASARLVWEGCNGQNTFDDLLAALRAEFGDIADEDMLLLALDDLAEHGLIESGFEPRETASVRFSRRRFFRRVGIAGAAAVAAPVVYSVVVPAAAAAFSGYTPSYTPY